MEVIDLDNPNWLALEDPYVLLGCKAIFDPDTGPDLESCTQDFERCYRCCASCRADCLQHFETNPETLGVYHAAYLAYLHPAQAVEDHAQPARSARRARSSGRRRTRRARPVSQTTSVRRPPSSLTEDRLFPCLARPHCILAARNSETLTIFSNFEESNYVQVRRNYGRQPSNQLQGARGASAHACSTGLSTGRRLMPMTARCGAAALCR
jgi:hypothetical protein